MPRKGPMDWQRLFFPLWCYSLILHAFVYSPALVFGIVSDPDGCFGQLGCRIPGRYQMRICDLIKTQETYQAELGQTVLETVQAMVERNIGAVPVMHNGKLMGIFSE